jgi:hypothetical protein
MARLPQFTTGSATSPQSGTLYLLSKSRDREKQAKVAG